MVQKPIAYAPRCSGSARRSTSTTSPTSCGRTARTSRSSRPRPSTACVGGIPEGLTYGQAWHAAVHPDDRALAGSLAQRLRAGEPVDVEYRLVGFDGITRWMWVRCAVRETRADGTLILDGVAQDVTARRDAQNRLSEIAEAIDEVLYVEEHYADGTIVETYSTRGIHKLFGIGPDDPVPDWRPHVHPEDIAISDQIDENMRRLVPSDLQYRLIGVDGRIRWIRDRVRPRLRADGVVIAEGILADVTAEKEALLALEAARARPTGWPASTPSPARSTAGTSPRRSRRSWRAPTARAPAPACSRSTSTTSRC